VERNRLFSKDMRVGARRPGGTIALDRLSAHIFGGIRECIEAAGGRLLYRHPSNLIAQARKR
jgi:hypothetical protein